MATTRLAALTAAAIALALTCPAGSRAETPAATAQVRRLTSDGIVRTYRVFHPSSAGAHPALVMMLHGGFGTGRGAEGADGWDALAAERGFVVVYPDGIGRAWNAGRCCGQPYARKIDDVAFLTAVIREVERHDGADPQRVFVTGMSNGAIMAYRMACESPVEIAAIGPVAGDLQVPCERPRSAVSVLAIHGTADQNVPLNGGFGTRGFTHTEHTSVAASLARWRAIDRCGSPTVTRRPPVVTETSACTGGTAVELITIEGAGHQWPGSKPPPALAVRMLDLDQPSTALDATAVLWEFFSRRS
jgi:polyhydroxybutyrate depolymerase